MTSSTVRILQLGDVHYPEAKAQGAAIDIKDPTFSPSVANSLSLQPFQAVSRSLRKLIEQSGIDALVLMGDLTSKGSQSGYEECVDFLSKSLFSLFPEVNWPGTIMLLAGNHDVDRKNYSVADLTSKFDPLNEILGRYRLPKLPVDAISTIRLDQTAGLGAVIYGMNSCIGCAEKRYLPTVLREEIFKAISAKITDVSANKDQYDRLMLDICEQLDTPAIESARVTELTEGVTELRQSFIPIVAAHHNLMPQVTPRVAMYTELVNSGQVRKSLLELNRTILYLHGHVHEDPIEIIHDPRFPQSQVISVSAPEMSAGFNIIDVVFHRSGAPLGCRITPYRVRPTGQVLAMDAVRIPFSIRGPTAALSAMAHQVFSALSGVEVMFHADLKGRVGTSTDAAETFEDALEELTWKQLIAVDNGTQDHSAWRVRKLI